MDVWADQLALYIWSGDAPADLGPIKAAKAELAIDQKVVPRGVGSLADLPTLDSRVLAVGSRPPFLCNYALTTERTEPTGWRRAVSWALGLVPEDPKATTILDTLTSIFGPGVREVSAEELEGERRMRTYINREE